MTPFSVAAQFSLKGTVTSLTPLGAGHINDTWEVTSSLGTKYCLQRINHHVFCDVPLLMANVEKVTAHIEQCVRQRRGDVDRSCLRLIPTNSGETYLFVQGNYYRMYAFIEESMALSSVSDPNLTFRAGKAFGQFFSDLATYKGKPLGDTIPSFHNTPYRYGQLHVAIETDLWDRVNKVSSEIAFALERREGAALITQGLANGTIPWRITHNDTKLNNVLFDKGSGEPLCVVDLDTIMPGSFLYDFGDAVRGAASTGAEDEPNLEKVHFSMEHFVALSQGLLKESRHFLTATEKKHLAQSAVIMTLECGIRFLTDHLEGDHYFKVRRSGQNLERCRTQFRMVQEMEKVLPEMEDVIESIVNE